MNPTTHAAIDEAFCLLPRAMNSVEARVVLYATGFQESQFEHRRQIIEKDGQLLPLGPAKGFWQFEKGGGCRGVLSHHASRYWMHQVCDVRGCAPKATDLWHNIENDDVLAAAAARLLYFTDPKKLPGIEDEEGAWNLYLRTWRPGKPKPDKWANNHARARALVLNQV